VRKIAIIAAPVWALKGSGSGFELAAGEYETVDIDGAGPGVQWLTAEPHGLVCVSASSANISYRTEN